MLANLKTTITRNIGSNAMAAAVNTAITDPVAVLFDKLVAKKTGVRTTTVGTGGYGKSTVQGIKESVEDYKLGINTRDKDANRYNEDLSDYGKDWFIGQAKSFNETGKFAIATIEYSPAGLVKTLAIDARNLQRAIKRGEGVALAQKKFVDGFCKAGVALMLYIADKKYSRLYF